MVLITGNDELHNLQLKFDKGKKTIIQVLSSGQLYLCPAHSHPKHILALNVNQPKQNNTNINMFYIFIFFILSFFFPPIHWVLFITFTKKSSDCLNNMCT
jgi:hypothetical protein